MLRIGGIAALAAAIAISAAGFCSCGKGPASGGSKAAGLSGAGASSAPGAGGRAIGRLRKLSGFPLYELEYWLAYDLGDLRLPPAAADGSGRSSSARESFACTCIAARLGNGHRALGRNFDWQAHPALVLLTRPSGGYASISLVDIAYLGYDGSLSPLDDPSGLEAAWRLPFDGMNEKGLAVGMMAVDRMEGDPGGNKPRVGGLGIMRILLDRASSVEEALALMDGYAIRSADPPLHYMLADATGDCAVVEYPGGPRRVFRAGQGWMVATNFLLSLVPPPAREAACWRYAKASSALREREGLLADGAALLGLLEGLSQASTRWSAAYDLAEGSLALALGRDYARIYRWNLRRDDSRP